MIVNARCSRCREKLPEFNSRTPPDEIVCSCGLSITGSAVLQKINDRIKLSHVG